MQKQLCTDDDVIIFVRSVDPAAHLNIDDQQLSVLLLGSIESASSSKTHNVPARLRRPKKLVWFAGSLSAVLAFGIASPAIADGARRIAQTGWFGSPNPGNAALHEGTTENDASEWLDSGAADFVAHAASLLPDYVTLPASAKRVQFANTFATMQSQGGLMQATGVKGRYETAARCLWVDEWLNAEALGEKSRTAYAAQQIVAASTWAVSTTRSDQRTIDGYRALGYAAVSGNRLVLEHEMLSGCATFVEALVK